MSYVVGRDVRENHKDYNQVLLDVRRSMKRFPKGGSVCVCVCDMYDVCVISKDCSIAKHLSDCTSVLTAAWSYLTKQLMN